MALVNFDEKDPPYMVLSPSAPVDVAATTNFFYFQNLIASDRITKTSNTRITFQESGVYEICFGCRIAGNSGVSSAYSMAVQYGVNGSWTTLDSCTSGNFIWITYARFSLIISVNANDYIEFRTLMGVTMTQNITLPSVGAYATSTIKRID